MKEQWNQILHAEDDGILSPVYSQNGELGLVCVKCEALYNLNMMGNLKNRLLLIEDFMLYSSNH